DWHPATYYYGDTYYEPVPGAGCQIGRSLVPGETCYFSVDFYPQEYSVWDGLHFKVVFNEDALFSANVQWGRN
ncbi:hypothetical protein LC612_38860, partial [Nostoc sp. CHAB 5834]|nr:hypothetical protein [Nostoc sp. CHAB 5834]